MHVALHARRLRDEHEDMFGTGLLGPVGSAVHERKPASIVRTWAFVIAAAILYIPANL